MVALACAISLAAVVIQPEEHQRLFQQQDELWEDLFSNPSHWWDNRQQKTNPNYPDFRHKTTRQPLWVDNRRKPIWVDSRLSSLHNLASVDGNGRYTQNGSFSSDDILLQTLCRQDDLDMAMDALSSINMPLAHPTYKLLLQACTRQKALHHVTEVQSHIIVHAPAVLRGSLGITLVVALSKCGAVEEAHKVSSLLRHRSVLSWTAMISACVDCGRAAEALKLYHLMEEDGIEPNSYTYVGIFKACGLLEDLELGRKLHADARRKGLASDSFVGSTLVNMYSKVGAIVEAEDAFRQLSEHDIVTWTAMLSAYVEDGQPEKALQLYRQMQQEGLDVDQMVYVTALKACIILAEREKAIVVDKQPQKIRVLEIGQAFHADASKHGFTTHMFVGTTLLSMYGKCGAIQQAEAMFGAIAQYDLVSWRTMLSAYIELGQGEKALHLYAQMQEKRIYIDALTYVIALQACVILAEREEGAVLNGTSLKMVALEIGEAIDVDVQTSKFASRSFVGTALVTMYGKCGTLEPAEAVFCALSQYDIVSWTAMQSVYVENGHAEKALQLFSLMQHEGLHPDQLTFMMAFQACTSLADKETAILVEGRLIKKKALEIGRALFADVGACGFTSDVGVNTYIVSMFGKCGAIKEAEDAFSELSCHSIMSWNAMLLAYVEYGQTEKAMELYRQMQNNRVASNDITFVCTLQACHKLGILELCMQVHFDIVAAGYDQMPSVVATLLHAYGSCASMADAQAIFDKIHKHDCDVVTWNAFISAYA